MHIGRVEAKLHSLPTSTLDGGEWSVSRPGRFTVGDTRPIPIELESVWSPVPVWTLWMGEKSAAAWAVPTQNGKDRF
jgi:hypothetical protein